MPTEIIMPQLGESVVEGTVSRWLIAEGQPVRQDQPLLQITTDKVDTELPAPALRHPAEDPCPGRRDGGEGDGAGGDR